MRSTCFIFLSVLVLILAGCGGGPTVTPVEGVTKINGKPAANLLIQFSPMTPPTTGKTLSATAVSDASGRFVLKCDDGRAGAMPGKHKVTVVDNNVGEEEDHPMSGKRPKFVQSRIPPHYASVTTTPIEIVVETGKKEYEVPVTYGQ